ncbi:discoidin domain-containing protein [Ruania suaedae]|uniref:discoidin domain-containing protein n=1 Tax=Ruania suaedae TaxID=2897774 RepID=UPI001E63C8E1|nr:discoidin domain-containing protein [Ruania suaedae]UFU02900.1 discoidin domain-containing protein [Ruania suaedae]
MNALATTRPSRRRTARRALGAGTLLALVATLWTGSAQAQGAPEIAAEPAIPAPDGSVWTDVDGNPIKAHGGSVVEVDEEVVGLDITGDGTLDQQVYLWYGEDKTNATRPVDGVRGYWSTDLVSWHDMGLVLPSHQHFTLQVNDEGTAVEVDPERVEEIKATANLTAPTPEISQEDIDDARAFIEPYVTAWADEDAGIAAEYDEENLANASYRLNGNINIMERPKMLYNELTGKFVIIYHADGPLASSPDLIDWVRDGGRRENQDIGSRYSRAEVGFATSDTPWGPFTLVNTTKMNWAEDVPNAGREGDSRDMTVFQDAGERTVDPAADDAYVVYSSEMNKWMYVSRLNAEYTGPLAEGSDAELGEDFSNRVLPDFSREASSVLKYDGYYYMITSGTDGWASTPVVAYRSPSMITDTEAVVGNNNGHPTSGQWERIEIANPCVGLASRDDVGTASPARCFDSQPTFAIAVDQEAGQFIYMGDRWITESNGSAGERSRYVWAPIQVDTEARSVTVENVGSFDPRNESLYYPLEPAEPLVFRVEPGDGSDFDPTFDVSAGDRSFSDVTADWDLAGADFLTPGTYRISGHVSGKGGTADLDERYVEAAVVVGDVMDACRLPGTTVSASFHQTDWGTFPAANACDGDESTSWSTWASNSGHPSEATFTSEFARPLLVGEVGLTNVEGAPSGVTVEYRDAVTGEWSATSAATVAPAENGEQTSIEFEPVTATGIRLVIDTPGSYLKISEVMIPAAQPLSDDATLRELTLDGLAVEGFDPDVSSYEVLVQGSAYPTLAATAAASASVTITQPAQADGVGSVAVVAEDGTESIYTVEVARQAVVEDVTLDGAARAGAETAAQVTVDPADAALGYQWYLDEEPLDGATAATYTPAPDEAGGALSVEVSATAAGFVDALTLRSESVVIEAAETDEDPGTDPGTDPSPTDPGEDTQSGDDPIEDDVADGATGDSDSEDELATTGATVGAIAVLALALLLAGALLIVRRHRSIG